MTFQLKWFLLLKKKEACFELNQFFLPDHVSPETDSSTLAISLITRQILSPLLEYAICSSKHTRC